MFEELEAKRVCRADLRSQSYSPSSTSGDEEIPNLLHSRLAELYGPIDAIPAISSTQTGKPSPNPELREDTSSDGFEFRLFAPKKSSKSPSDVKTGRIILEKDDESLDGNGGFVIPWRDPRYFFTGESTALQKQQFASVAVSGEDVLSGLQIRHTGLEVPWRVSNIRLNQSLYKKLKAQDAEVKDEKTPEDGPSKRKRMGKKMRILHRKREKIRKESELSEQQKLAQKEAAEREKKTKRNREKQQKKRAKEKAKKASNISEAGSSSAPAQADIIMNEG